MEIKIAPSILSSDFGRLNEEIKEVEPYSDMLHVDVMDGHFVPNITIGPEVVKCIRTRLPLDVHLMISDPVKYAPAFAKAGASSISFHAEAFGTRHELKKAVMEVKKTGVKVGLTVNPDRPISLIVPVLEMTDFVLIMSVHAGFGGQKFIPDVLDKIKELRQKHGYGKDIEIDGGINAATAALAVRAGANVLIAGSSIFGAEDRKKAIQEIREGVRKHA
jgi:ribulose-phosphate 3-epimerase